MTVADPRFAVLLNPNARRVSRYVQRRVREIVQRDDVFVSADEAGAERHAETILTRGYDTVFTGGGDGTVTHFINSMPDEIARPRVGILRLGTGNAMAEMVSRSGHPLRLLSDWVASPSEDTYTLPLCEAEGRRFAFGGLGVDAWVLNDYVAFKQRLRGRFEKMRGLSAYVAAAATRTIPRMARRWAKKLEARVVITNAGGPVHAITQDAVGGHLGRAYAPGEVLYDGPFNAVMFGTCPFYGYRLKALPFAGLDPERFHLRVSNVPLPRIVANVGRLWRGTLRHDGFSDFHAERIHLRFSEPMPYQVAGEATGFREELTIGMAARSVDLLRLG